MFWEPIHVVVNYTNVHRLCKILFIILIRLCIHYPDWCCINLDNWNIFQQHKRHNYAWFFCCHDDNENEAVEAHIHDIEIPRPKNHDIEIPRPKNHDIEIPRLKNHDIEIPRPKSRDIEFLWNADPYAPW